MEVVEEDYELKLVKLSPNLLSDLLSALPKFLRRCSRSGGNAHTKFKQRDLDYIISLIEPFQSEPQLLDARLKDIVPQIVDAHIDYLLSKPKLDVEKGSTFEEAVCIILYTLCKVRGHKVIIGFFNNEPRYLELIVEALEQHAANERGNEKPWQISYVLLLWLSHLLLTPFDLASISNSPGCEYSHGLLLHHDLPPIAVRILGRGLKYLPSPTKSQDAAASMIVRLVRRPDMQKLRLGDAVVLKSFQSMHEQESDVPTTIYEQIGSLRFLAGITGSADFRHLVPTIYRNCEQILSDQNSSTMSNAVAKKIVVRIYRNVVILSLRSGSAQGPMRNFLETTSVVENVIDYLLRTLGDRDTPVRYAAAKAISLIIMDLDQSMGHEVIQALLDTFKDDVPRYSDALDFRTVNPLKWHGLTLTLSHTLFKRSASPEQMSDIIEALSAALQFEQRTSTGSSVGTSVRDAANFGIWSLSRRYTTSELRIVQAKSIRSLSTLDPEQSVIQGLAIQLVLSACFDPAGNIRRGSSAALQELIGRHPNQVEQGIALVQIVDYQAVGLRKRGMIDVANRVMALHPMYWTILHEALLGWRGIGSSDVLSREAAATSLARASLLEYDVGNHILKSVLYQTHTSSDDDMETLHGLVSSLANLLNEVSDRDGRTEKISKVNLSHAWDVLKILTRCTEEFSPRLIRSELPAATARFLTALFEVQFDIDSRSIGAPWGIIDGLVDRLLSRQEDTILQDIPSLVRSLIALKHHAGTALGQIEAQVLCDKVVIDSSKSTLYGAGRAIALGTLAPLYRNGLSGEISEDAISTLGRLTHAQYIDWRIIGVKALQYAIGGIKRLDAIQPTIADSFVGAAHEALNDYTIDERGDVGSLVRLQAIDLTSSVLAMGTFNHNSQILQLLQADAYRLSLEKLDRVRLAAGQLLRRHLGFIASVTDVASVSTRVYFAQSLQPLIRQEPLWKQTALLEGYISCAGVSGEPLLQASRAALVQMFAMTTFTQLMSLMSLFAGIMKSLLAQNGNLHSALEVLAFLLDMQIPQRLEEMDFKWLNLLSTVQKSHHKSNDISKILAAVHVYRGLAEIRVIRGEVMKKLIGMLRTNPYPKVRSSVAETLFVLTNETILLEKDWTKGVSQQVKTIEELHRRYISN